MAGENPQVQGRPTPKFGLTGPSFPTQANDDVTLTEEVAYAVMANGAADLKIPAFGTPHPRSQAHRLIAVACLGGNEGKIWYRLTFSKLPGHLLPGASVSEQTWGAPAVVTKQSVLAGTPPQTGIGVIQSDVQPQDAQTAVATATTVIWPTLTTTRINERGDLETVTQTKVAPGTVLPEFSYTTTSITQQAETMDRATLAVGSVSSYSLLTDHEGTTSNRGLLHFIAGAQKTTTHSIVAPSTAADIGFNVVESAVRAQNVARSDKTTTTVVSWPTLNSTAVIDPQAHGAATTTKETIVSSASTAIVDGLNLAYVLEAKVEDTDGTHAIQTIKTLGDGTGSVQWPVLTRSEPDPEMGVIVTMSRQEVAAGSTTPGAVIQQSPLAVVITAADPVEGNKNLETRVITTIPQSAACSYETGVFGTDTTGYAFPDLLDVATAIGANGQTNAYNFFTKRLAYSQRKAELLIVQTRKWWVVSSEKPTISELTQIIPEDIQIVFTGGGALKYSNVLHDAFVSQVSVGSATGAVLIPASTPSWSTYINWIAAGKFIVIRASVTDVKYQLLWKCMIHEVLAR